MPCGTNVATQKWYQVLSFFVNNRFVHVTSFFFFFSILSHHRARHLLMREHLKTSHQNCV